jgi:hypothetical protein
MRVTINIRHTDNICAASRVLFLFHENGLDLGYLPQKGVGLLDVYDL